MAGARRRGTRHDAPRRARGLTATPRARRPARHAALRAWLADGAFGLLLFQWTLCSVGHLAVVSILSLYLLTTLGLPAAAAGATLLFATLAARLAPFALAPLLDRVEPRRALGTVLGCAAAGYAVLASAAASTAVLVVALPIVGTAFGCNALLVKALTATYDRDRIVRYSALNAALNAGAALGPLVGTALFFASTPRATFALASACFALGAVVALRLPARTGERPPRVPWLDSLRTCASSRDVRRAVVAMAWVFVFASQLYAVLPLAATHLLGSPHLLGVCFALNALVVVALQMPVARLAVRLDVAPRALLALGFVSYGAGFLLLWAWPSWPAALAMVVTCSIAEVLMPPAVDATMAAALPPSMRVSGFSLNSVAGALGEGAGVGLGVAAARHLADAGRLELWYAVLALCALVALTFVATAVGGRRPAASGTVARSDDLIASGAA